MPYDASLDENLFSKSSESDAGKITVSVFSYNNGVKKLQISRENRTGEGEYRFAKLSRMTKEEAEAVIPFMQEAIKSMA